MAAEESKGLAGIETAAVEEVKGRAETGTVAAEQAQGRAGTVAAVPAVAVEIVDDDCEGLGEIGY